MSARDFKNQVTALGYAYVNATAITQTITSAGAWVDMKLSDATESDITKNVRIGSIGTDLYTGKFTTTTIGIYFFQLGFTFMGSASANYKIRALLNDNQIDTSVIQFTTRGTNVMWEVGMSFIVECGYKGSNNSGLNSSINDISLECQNVSGTGDLKVSNALYHVMKID